MRLIATLIALSAASCFAGPRYVTKHGLVVYCDDSDKCWQQPEVEIVTQAFIDAAPKRGTLVRALATGWYELRIRDEDKSFPCRYDGKDGRCTGQYFAGWGEVDVIYTPCALDGSLTHELVHMYQFSIDLAGWTTNSAAHKDPTYYGAACAADDVVCREDALLTRVDQIAEMRLWCTPGISK